MFELEVNMAKNNAAPELELANNASAGDVAAENEDINTTLDENTTTQNGNEDQVKSSSDQERYMQLEQELQLAKQSKDEYYNRMLRIQADFENFRRRSRQEYEQVCLFAGEDIIKKILPVIDNLERAISCFKDNGDNSSWQEGVQLTLKQLQEILKSEGLEPIQSLNMEFDPQIHEAILQEESENYNVPTVIEELQKGYKFKNKLLRPALVKVAAPKSS